MPLGLAATAYHIPQSFFPFFSSFPQSRGLGMIAMMAMMAMMAMAVIV